MSEAYDPVPPGRLKSRPALMVAGALLVVLGGGAGALAMQATRPTVAMAPATPVAIQSLPASGIVTVKGRVGDVFGNKFIVADTSGRALIDTGRDGEGRDLVTPGETVMVQGRSDRGSVHAAFLVGPDSKVIALGPLDGPPPPRGPGRPGPDAGPDGGPPPPPPPPGVGPGAPPPPPPPVAGAGGNNPPPPPAPAPGAARP